jgi:flagellar capping protein FliD
MDSELKQYLEAMEQRLNTQITAAVTASEERLTKRIDESGRVLEERFTKRIDESGKELEERLVERIRDTETTLLTEFHKWASPIDTRVRGLSSMLRAVDADLEYFQERLKKLENRPTGT